MLFRKKTPRCLRPRKPCRGGPDPASHAQDRHLLLGTPLKGPYPDGHRDRLFRDGLFLGRRAAVLAASASGIVTTAVGYQGGHTPNPTYEETCTGMHRPRRGRDGGLRPEGRSPTRPCSRLFWEKPRPHPGHAAGQRRRHHLPVDASTRPRRPSSPRPRPLKAAYDEALEAAPASGPDHHRDPCRPRTFYFAEDLPPAIPAARIRAAIATSPARASPARWGSAWRPPRNDAAAGSGFRAPPAPAGRPAGRSARVMGGFRPGVGIRAGGGSTSGLNHQVERGVAALACPGRAAAGVQLVSPAGQAMRTGGSGSYGPTWASPCRASCRSPVACAADRLP